MYKTIYFMHVAWREESTIPWRKQQGSGTVFFMRLSTYSLRSAWDGFLDQV